MYDHTNVKLFHHEQFPFDPKCLHESNSFYLLSLNRSKCAIFQGSSRPWSSRSPNLVRNPPFCLFFCCSRTSCTCGHTQLNLFYLLDGLHWLSEEGNAKTYITVHYVLQSQAYLEEYLAKQQPSVASAEQERFQFLVTSRRTLSVVF